MRKQDSDKDLIAGSDPQGERAALPSYLHGWRFLSVIRSDDPEALAFKAMAANEGPCIVVNPELVSHDDLESPSKALLWVCAALNHIAHAVISECLWTGHDIGRFDSPAWDLFREEASRHTTMGWSDIVMAARREGVDYMAETVAACLFVESGLQSRLIGRITGAGSIKLA
mgnify:CR=1 FL=1|jgi:hypothetical protein